jgi:tetratricopeptide (TPR) repeat protein
MRYRCVAAAAILLGALLPRPPALATERALELPVPELPVPPLTITVRPVPLSVSRPPLHLQPPLPSLGPRLVTLGPPPLPRVDGALPRPVPPTPDPGSLSCGLATIVPSAGNLARCGVSRALRDDPAGARKALRESVGADPHGSEAAVAYLWLAAIGFRESRHDEAEGLYEAALQRGLPGPLAAHAQYALGWLRLLRGNASGAREAFEWALSPPPPPPIAKRILFLDGVARLVSDEPGDALARWNELDRAGLPPELLPELGFWRGVALVRSSHPDAGLRSLTDFLARAGADHPLREEATAWRGWAQLAAGRAELALQEFAAASALRRGDGNVPLHVGLVRAYVALGRYAPAREAIDRLAGTIAGAALVPELLLHTAEEALRRAADAEAIESYRQLRARAGDPGLRAYATYRIAEARERGDAAARRAAEEEYVRLSNDGGDEALAQRAGYWLAVRALEERRPEDALRRGEDLLRAGVLPALRERTLILTAEAAARAGAPPRTAALLRVALEQNPDPDRIDELHLVRGWALFEGREPGVALLEWQQAARSADRTVSVAAHAAMAHVSLEWGYDAEALRALEWLASTHQDTPLIGLNLAIVLLRTGDFAATIDVLRPLLPHLTAPDRHLAARRALGAALYHRGQYREAQEMFAEAAQRQPGEATNWLGLGLAALQQERRAEADRALRRARLAEAPDVATAAAFGLVLAARHDPKEFERRADTFVAAFPQHPSSGALVSHLVARTLERGQGEYAYTWAKWLLAQQPGSPQLEDVLIRLAAGSYGRPTLAREIYRDVLAHVRHPLARRSARIGLAHATLSLGQLGEAQEVLAGFIEEAPPADPRLPWAYTQLIQAYDAQGRRRQVLATAEAFIDRFPADPAVPAVQLTRAQHLLQDGRWEDAREAMERARDTGEPSIASRAHLWLGEVLRARGAYDDALGEYLSATYVYPDTASAPFGLRGAAEIFLSREMPREARLVLNKLVERRGVDPDLVRWAQEQLRRLGGAAVTAARPSALAKQP